MFLKSLNPFFLPFLFFSLPIKASAAWVQTLLSYSSKHCEYEDIKTTEQLVYSVSVQANIIQTHKFPIIPNFWKMCIKTFSWVWILHSVGTNRSVQ